MIVYKSMRLMGYSPKHWMAQDVFLGLYCLILESHKGLALASVAVPIKGGWFRNLRSTEARSVDEFDFRRYFSNNIGKYISLRCYENNEANKDAIINNILKHMAAVPYYTSDVTVSKANGLTYLGECSLREIAV